MTLSIQPVLFNPSLEFQEKDEQQTIVGMIETLKKITEKTFKDTGEHHRGVHAKSHGFLFARFTIPSDLPVELQQGLFARSGTHDALLRFSTPPGDLLDDSVSLPRAMAIKILNTEPVNSLSEDTASADSSRLDQHDTAVQDFLMINGPVFNAKDAAHFLKNLKPLAVTTDRAEGAKKVLSTVLRATERMVESVGKESPTIKSMGGHAQTHILGETFFTQAPLLFGKYAAKISVAPVSDMLTALKDLPIGGSGDPDILRSLVSEFFRDNGGTWEMRVQLQTDVDTMPIEDSSVKWNEDESPYLTIGTVTTSPQLSWTDEKQALFDKKLFFSPWNCLPEHRPLGSVMRVRREVYQTMATARGAKAVPSPSDLHTAMKRPQMN